MYLVIGRSRREVSGGGGAGSTMTIFVLELNRRSSEYFLLCKGSKEELKNFPLGRRVK